MNKCTLSAHVSRKSGCIFVVEDNEAIREFLAIVLRTLEEYTVAFATCGSEALSMLRTFRPDLLLLDYHLPDMTGLQFYELMRARKKLRPVPAIFMSATLPHWELEERCFLCLPKPFRIEQLRKAIQQTLVVCPVPEDERHAIQPGE